MLPLQRRPFLNSFSLFLSALAVTLALHTLGPILLPSAIAHPSIGTDSRDRPAALTDVTLTPDGLGPLRINASPSAAATAIGTPLDPWEPDSTALCRFHGVPGLEGVGIMVADGAIARIDIWDAAARITTPAGIGIGHHLRDLERAYPNQVRLEPHPHLPSWKNAIISVSANSSANASTRQPSGQWRFTLDEGGQIRQFRAGRLPETAWTSGCA